MRPARRILIAVIAGALCVATAWSSSSVVTGSTSPSMTRAVPRASCAAADHPEPGIQGRVPLRDRTSGRSQQGYTCNLTLLGQFRGEGSSWVSQSYRDCAYVSTHFPNTSEHPGVQVLDVSDVRHPKRVGTLTDPAMLGSWESLKVNNARGLLAAVSAPSPGGNGLGFFAVYDIATDCARPQLLGALSAAELALPTNGVGHEGNWAPDGMTYWSASANSGTVTAIDVTDPSTPAILYEGQTSRTNHGLSLNRDGTRLYIAKIGMGSSGPMDGNGVQIFDVSEVQDRVPAPQISLVGEVTWDDGTLGQHAIPVTYDGQPFLIFVDEGGNGAARIIDIGDETRPQVVSKIKLQIHQPRYADLRAKDTAGSGFFGYEGHYCGVDRLTDPRHLACGYFQSGVRVFDIRDRLHPREIAYFNPPAQLGHEAELESSEHASNPLGGTLNTDWCSSPPRFVGHRQLWVTCQDNGFLALKFRPGVLSGSR